MIKTRYVNTDLFFKTYLSIYLLKGNIITDTYYIFSKTKLEFSLVTLINGCSMLKIFIILIIERNMKSLI